MSIATAFPVLAGTDEQVRRAAEYRDAYLAGLYAGLEKYRARMEAAVAAATNEADRAKYRKRADVTLAGLSRRIDAIASTVDAKWWIECRFERPTLDSLFAASASEALAATA